MRTPTPTTPWGRASLRFTERDPSGPPEHQALTGHHRLDGKPTVGTVTGLFFHGPETGAADGAPTTHSSSLSRLGVSSSTSVRQGPGYKLKIETNCLKSDSNLNFWSWN